MGLIPAPHHTAPHHGALFYVPLAAPAAVRHGRRWRLLCPSYVLCSGAHRAAVLVLRSGAMARGGASGSRSMAVAIASQ